MVVVLPIEPAMDAIVLPVQPAMNLPVLRCVGVPKPVMGLVMPGVEIVMGAIVAALSNYGPRPRRQNQVLTPATKLARSISAPAARE